MPELRASHRISRIDTNRPDRLGADFPLQGPGGLEHPVQINSTQIQSNCTQSVRHFAPNAPPGGGKGITPSQTVAPFAPADSVVNFTLNRFCSRPTPRAAAPAGAPSMLLRFGSWCAAEKGVRGKRLNSLREDLLWLGAVQYCAFWSGRSVAW
jgi:hypothetical protein